MKKIALLIPVLLVAGCVGPSSPLQNAMVVFKQTAAPVEGKKYVYTVSPAVPLSQIYNAQQAQQIVEDFRAAYIKLGAPRINISVNLPQGTFEVPQLPTVGVGGTPQIDPATGLPMPVGVGGAAPAAAPRIFDTDELSTRQTKREVELLFGRPLRLAGATLIDPAQTNLPELTLEILLGEREITVPGINGTKTHTVPDIIVTATRAADGQVLGQATVLDLFPHQAAAARMLQRYNIQQLTEATALALMKDIASTAK
ncbi:MAG TPA: hypothetical protein EYQ62_01830 [Verrucomicrobiales bacterium]|jgi:hypothetical protein|nr:hypothetical protein [Verrucomicrobiales bacterium]